MKCKRLYKNPKLKICFFQLLQAEMSAGDSKGGDAKGLGETKSEKGEQKKKKEPLKFPGNILPSKWMGVCFEGRGLRSKQIKLMTLKEPTIEPELRTKVFFEWKTTDDTPKDVRVYPTDLWFQMWEAVSGPKCEEFFKPFIENTSVEKDRMFKLHTEEQRELLSEFVIRVLQNVGVNQRVGQLYMVSSFGHGFYQLMPEDWKRLETATENFCTRVSEYCEAKHREQHPGHFNANECSSDKGCWSENDVSSDSIIESFQEAASDEREALGIETDSEDEKEDEDTKKAEAETDEEPEGSDETKRQVKDLREKAKQLLQQAREIQSKGSTQRKHDRRFENGRSWVVFS